MKKRHRWKPLKKKDRNVLDKSTGVIYRPRSSKECVYCGLRKGDLFNNARFGYTVYWKNGTFLTKDRLPFSCTGASFISEGEFLV